MYEIHKINDITNLYHPEIGVIPDNPENRHYAAYLEWLAEGNTPEEITLEP
jgi:hypothetical protein